MHAQNGNHFIDGESLLNYCSDKWKFKNKSFSVLKRILNWQTAVGKSWKRFTSNPKTHFLLLFFTFSTIYETISSRLENLSHVYIPHFAWTKYHWFQLDPLYWSTCLDLISFFPIGKSTKLKRLQGYNVCVYDSNEIVG